MKLIKSLLYQALSQNPKPQWEKLKRLWVRDLGSFPKNSQIYAAYQQLLEEKKIEKNEYLEKSLKVRNVRTLSGVAPFAVMMKPFHCPGRCIYCPLEAGMPKSYMSDEPAAARAKKLNFDPKAQVLSRIEQLEAIGHHPEKLQIIVIGGTFSAYPLDYRKQFLKAIFDACNGFEAKTIDEAITANQTAKYRIIGMSIETRPDWVTDEEIKLIRDYGVTKVQLGVQALDNQINKITKRGHNIDAVRIATAKLRDAGMKINYHFMPNLPGSNPKKDVEMAKKMFSDPDFRPDTLKIYPTIVIPHTALWALWKKGQYQPYDDQTLIKTLTDIKLQVPQYCRIDRLVRDITRQWTAAGTLKTNMRQLVANYMKEHGLHCQCIRCREVKAHRELHKDVSLKILKYQASRGEEQFLQYCDRDYIYGMLRLRFVDENPINQNLHKIFPVLKDAALIRELHVYGKQVNLDSKQKQASQHQSLGKKLIAKAEEIAKSKGYKKIAIISGVGVRGYYQKLGYHLQDTYMVKELYAD